MTIRIAMWSCSRNVSTATMRSWGSRSDTTVSDEPLYAAWLRGTGAPHPMRDVIVAHHESDWRVVIDGLCGPQPAEILYEKHISKHLLPAMDRAWLASHRHAFLIRDPHPMLLSFQRKLEHVTVEETGLPQQMELWMWLKEQHGIEAPVVDARDLLTDPSGVLQQLCQALEVPWDPAMLGWEPGLRSTDGVWAPHWYDAVVSSTGFRSWSAKTGELSPELQAIHDACLPAYRFLAERRIRSSPD